MVYARAPVCYVSYSSLQASRVSGAPAHVQPSPSFQNGGWGPLDRAGCRDCLHSVSRAKQRVYARGFGPKPKPARVGQTDRRHLHNESGLPHTGSKQELQKTNAEEYETASGSRIADVSYLCR